MRSLSTRATVSLLLAICFVYGAELKGNHTEQNYDACLARDTQLPSQDVLKQFKEAFTGSHIISVWDHKTKIADNITVDEMIKILKYSPNLRLISISCEPAQHRWRSLYRKTYEYKEYIKCDNGTWKNFRATNDGVVGVSFTYSSIKHALDRLTSKYFVEFDWTCVPKIAIDAKTKNVKTRVTDFVKKMWRNS
eukprot:806287_1